MIEPAQRAAIAALDHEGELLDRVARLSALRDEVRAELLALGWAVPVAQGNFVWLATGVHTADAAETFLRHGIVTRPLGDDGLRVSVGEAESVPRLLAGAAEVLEALPAGHPARRTGADGGDDAPAMPHRHRADEASLPSALRTETPPARA